jgi:serine/threonine protein kinase/tetratricopeptide (TPR) repeat protein
LTDTLDFHQQLQASLGSAYVLGRELGGGGMARIFIAEEKGLGRRVVVKVLPPESTGAASVERFRREAQVAAGLQHPHIVPLLAAGESGGLLFYTMPFVEGETLRSRLSRDGAFPLPAAVRVLRDVATALAYAHRRAVMHRDIKPENILIGEGGDALVADFGLAKAIAVARVADAPYAIGGLTSVGVAVGTPAYMAPEQSVADPTADGRADLYSFGVVAYEVLAGSHPFAGRTPHALLAAHATEAPEGLTKRRASVPADLEALVMRLLAKHPADRPQSADEVLAILDGVVTSSSSGNRPVAARSANRFQRLGLQIAVAAGVLALAGYAGYKALHRPARPSIAVLPFENSSRSPEDSSFSDGLTDDLIGDLSKLAGLTVIGRTSVFAFRDKHLTVAAEAESLGVTSVLGGSVSRAAGGRVQVRVDLTNAKTSRVLWSARYDRELKDVFAVQEEIVQAIVNALRVQLGGPTGRLVRPGTLDTAAYNLYLLGQYSTSRLSARDLEKAIDYYKRAISRDPTYARAFAGLADVYGLLGLFANRPPSEVVPRQRAAIDSALKLDSTLADAHKSLGSLMFVSDRDWPGARAQLELSLKIDPGNAMGHGGYGIWMMDQGRFDEAEAAFERARVLDPLLPPLKIILGRLYRVSNRPDRAVPVLDAAVGADSLNPLANEELGHAYLQYGKHVQALAAFRRAAAFGGPRDSAQLAYGLAMTGDTAAAMVLLRRLRAVTGRYLPPVDVAMAYVGLGNADSAFRWLGQAERENAPMDAIKIEPAFSPLHTDSRWTPLLRRLRFEP